MAQTIYNSNPYNPITFIKHNTDLKGKSGKFYNQSFLIGNVNKKISEIDNQLATNKLTGEQKIALNEQKNALKKILESFHPTDYEKNTYNNETYSEADLTDLFSNPENESLKKEFQKAEIIPPTQVGRGTINRGVISKEELAAGDTRTNKEDTSSQNQLSLMEQSQQLYNAIYGGSNEKAKGYAAQIKQLALDNAQRKYNDAKKLLEMQNTNMTAEAKSNYQAALQQLNTSYEKAKQATPQEFASRGLLFSGALMQRQKDLREAYDANTTSTTNQFDKVMADIATQMTQLSFGINENYADAKDTATTQYLASLINIEQNKDAGVQAILNKLMTGDSNAISYSSEADAQKAITDYNKAKATYESSGITNTATEQNLKILHENALVANDYLSKNFGKSYTLESAPYTLDEGGQEVYNSIIKQYNTKEKLQKYINDNIENIGKGSELYNLLIKYMNSLSA